MIIYDFYSQVSPNSSIIKCRDIELIRVTRVGSKIYDSKIITEKHHRSTISIGKFCSISIGCQFILGGNHNYERLTTYLPFSEGLDIENSLKTNGDIVIGNDVWIGQNVTIMSGVTVGSGAVIAANSTVTKDVEPYSIVGGIPAKKIKNRFNKEVIDFLLESKWWDINKQKLIENEDLIFNNDIKVAIEFIKSCLKY